MSYNITSVLPPDLTESPDNRTEYNPQDIVDRLGIQLPGLAGKKVLDLGCGPTGKFVHFLRSHGVEAYGLDSRSVVSSPFLMQAEADEIPQPDSPYHLITAHFSVFRLGVSGFINSLMQQKRLTTEINDMNLFAMEQILEQMAWVSQPGSKAIIVPFPDALSDFLQQYTFIVEDFFSDAQTSQLASMIIDGINPCPALRQRLIISY